MLYSVGNPSQAPEKHVPAWQSALSDRERAIHVLRREAGLRLVTTFPRLAIATLLVSTKTCRIVVLWSA